MMKIGKGFHNQTILLLVVVFLFTNTAYGIDLSEKTYLRKKLSLDTKKDKPRIVCAFLAASYQNNILKHKLSPEKAFAILNEEMDKLDSEHLGIKIARDIHDIWIYYEATNAEDSIYIVVYPDGQFGLKTKDDFNKAWSSNAIAMLYSLTNLPDDLQDLIYIKEMGAKYFGGYIVPDSVDNRPFVPIKGLLLATGKAHYIDREDFESKGEEIIFVDEDIYDVYSGLIHSGKIRIDEIDQVSMVSLPDNFIPEGHFNRANRIRSEVKKMVKKKGEEFLGYVNEKRREMAREWGLLKEEIKPLEQDELYAIVDNMFIICLNKSSNTIDAGLSDDRKRRWITFSLDYLSKLNDEEFAAVYAHELGHHIVDLTIPTSAIEKKLNDLLAQNVDTDGNYDMLQLDGGLSEGERIELSRIFIAGEDTADLTSETITGSSRDVLIEAVRKSDEITTEESSRQKVMAALKIRTHPGLFTRERPIIQQKMQNQTVLTWAKVVSEYLFVGNMPIVDITADPAHIMQDVTELLEGLSTDSRTSI